MAFIFANMEMDLNDCQISRVLIQNEYSPEFIDLVDKLATRFQPERIYCFARNSQMSGLKSCFAKSGSVVVETYFLLVVTKQNTRIEHQIQDFASAHFSLGTIIILAHGREMIERALDNGSRFFTTVYSNADLVYTKDGLLGVDGPCLIEAIGCAAGYAPKYYDHMQTVAGGFLKAAEGCFSKGQYSACVFLLHQVIEQCCFGLIGVHLGYRADLHNLHRLIMLCRSFSDQPYLLFFSGCNAEEKLFRILSESYAKVRYDLDYRVEEGSAARLLDLVSDFWELSNDLCKLRSE